MVKRLYAMLKALQQGGYNAETLADDKTMVASDVVYQRLDPGGSSRNVTLQAEVNSTGRRHVFYNAADAAGELLTIKDDGGSTICTVSPGESAEVTCNGTAWTGIVVSATGVDPAIIPATVAAAGTNQGTATAITEVFNNVTGADGAKGVALPTAATGGQCFIYNAGTSPLLVYPASSDDINDGGANTAVYVGANAWAVFKAMDATTWAADGVSRSATVGIRLVDFRKTGAIKDVLADSAGSNLLGLGDAEGSALTGTSTDGGGTATASETAQVEFPLPENYVPGSAITVTFRAKVAAAKNVAQTIDLVAKLRGDAAVGSDICATAAQNLTTSYASYAFSITPTGLVPGDVLNLDVALATDDTGASNAGAPTITKATVSFAVKP